MHVSRLASPSLAIAFALTSGACESERPSGAASALDVTTDTSEGGKVDAPFELDTGSEPDTTPEADTTTEPDATPEADTTPEPDATPEADASPEADATPDGPVQATFGTLTGACGTLSAEFTSTEPSFHSNVYTFDAAFDAEALRSLAKKRLDGNNNGGSSKCSETMSIQTLFDCDGLVGLKTELEIAWDVVGQTTDWLGEVNGVKVGVSVSRAYQGPDDQTYTVQDAITLLEKKLGGINESTANVSATDAWQKQVLHIWTLQPTWVPILEEGWNALSPELRADTVVVVTVEQGSTAITTDDCE